MLSFDSTYLPDPLSIWSSSSTFWIKGKIDACNCETGNRDSSRGAQGIIFKLRSFHPKCVSPSSTVSPDLKVVFVIGEKVDSPGPKIGLSEVFFHPWSNKWLPKQNKHNWDLLPRFSGRMLFFKIDLFTNLVRERDCPFTVCDAILFGSNTAKIAVNILG